MTGAGQGVGQRHAELLASLGAAVVVNDLGESAEKVAAEIVERGGRAVAHLGSASDWDAAGSDGAAGDRRSSASCTSW